MNLDSLFAWLQSNPLNMAIAVSIGALLAFLIAYFVVARGLVYLTTRTQNQWDDILVKYLRPYRLAWIAPFTVVYLFADQWPDIENSLRTGSLLIIVWIGALSLISVLSAVNMIYEGRATYSGVSIQSYLDLGKLLLIAIGVILTVSLITGQSPFLLLSGLGAITAILLLIFHDTILSLVASVQIVANDLVREGDWIEVPGFNADGDVLNISLNSIKIQNFDKTFTVIPTYKLMEVSFKNWRGMSQSGGRRIKRSIYIDIQTIHFSSEADLQRLKNIELLKDYIAQRSWNPDSSGPENLRRPTNLGAFMAYIEAYLKSRPDVRQDMTLMVRHLDPTPEGLPIEIYVFANSIGSNEYEAMQASIFDHLLAIISEFDLRVFQAPTGRDFGALLGQLPS